MPQLLRGPGINTRSSQSRLFQRRGEIDNNSDTHSMLFAWTISRIKKLSAAPRLHTVHFDAENHAAGHARQSSRHVFGVRGGARAPYADAGVVRAMCLACSSHGRWRA